MNRLPWHEQSIEEVSANLGTDANNGLSSGEISARLEKYGPNELKQEKGKNVFHMLLEQLRFMVIIFGSQSGISAG